MWATLIPVSSGPRVLGHAGRHPGNHHLAIPLLLAGGRKWRRISLWESTVALREGASNGNCAVPGTTSSRHVLFEPGDVLHYSHGGATLHAHGKTTISTAREAAEALRPLAGDGAYCSSAWV